ncbi:MAG: N-acetylmuramidase [Candidatus Dojkabacteria bacterium]|nr:N-acetylmuramidase [Candidatus Dojkabacteria bacterium]
MANFNFAIEKTLKWEGGYVNDPKDPGGETKYGISKASYPSLDIANLSLTQAKDIYKKNYWDKIQGDKINSQKIAESIFDFAVNAGVSTSVKLTQQILNVNIDGVLGNQTLNALNSFNQELFLLKFTLAKIQRYIQICNNRPSSIKFLFGWIRRTLEHL